jgi:translation initiation factor IF-3
VRLIDENGEQLGILPIAEAIAHAKSKGLDLVEVSPNTNPSVCRVLDYGKFKYQQSKKLHEAKKKQTVIHIKEVKLRPKTEKHDYNVKLNHVKRFINDGNKAKVTMRFKGREVTHAELGKAMLDRIAEDVNDIADVEQKPRLESRRSMVMILAPKK